MTKIIIIDNIPLNFINQPNNGLSIKTWTDDINDDELYQLMKILNFIYFEKKQNVTHIIKNINTLINTKNYMYSNIDLNSINSDPNLSE